MDIIKSNYPDIKCTDSYCSNGLVCTQCLLGYAVVGGKCIAENNCREYAYYVPPAVSTAWSAVNCKCLDGHWWTTFAKCGQRCHISCKSCSGLLSTQCLSCYSEYKLVSGACVINATAATALNTYTWVAGDSQTGMSIYPSTPTSCGGFSTLFGYEDQDKNNLTTTATLNKYFSYKFTTSGLNYYAIRVKIGLLFVDEFHPRGAIYISWDTNTSTPVWTWNFDTKGAYGEQMCGSNKMDYVIYATAELPTRNKTL